MRMLYVHIGSVFDRLYASERVEATHRNRFKTLDRKLRPRSQSYIGLTSVGRPSLYATNNKILKSSIVYRNRGTY